MSRRYYILYFILITIICFEFTSCSINENIKQSTKSTMNMPKQFRSVLCKGYITKTGEYKPIDITNRFIKGEDESVFLFTEYFDLYPNAKYTPRWEWYGPKLDLIRSSSIESNPKCPHWYMWGELVLNEKDRESGLWIVKAYLNDNLISEKQFLVAKDSIELKFLEKELLSAGIRLESENMLNDVSKKTAVYDKKLNQNKFKIAVVEFQSIGLNKDKDFLGKMISEMFTTEVVKSEAFKIIERDQLKKVIDEIMVGQSGIIDTSEAQKLGKLLGADAIITGSVMKLQDDLRIDSRIIEVKTGVIVSAESKICKEILSDISSKVIEMTKSLSDKFYIKKKAK